MGYIGLNDNYSIEDLLEVSNSIQGLTEFIENCSLPMTFSIQGDWGSGKSSIMHMIEKKLNEDKNSDVETMWIETWPYSQFDMENRLANSFLLLILSELQQTKEAKTAKELLRIASENAAKVTKAVLAESAKKYLGQEFAQTISNFEIDTEKENPTFAINQLRDKFSNAIKKHLKNKRKKRMVIFVDDLDRIQPKRAVELLEVMNIFINCDSCVFVLAVDYSVVVRGVLAKYGNDFDEKKCRDFFDKIIQVPYRVPVMKYDIAKYINSCLKGIGVDNKKDDEQLKKYQMLLEASVGKNPRSIKRIFNAFLLSIKSVDKKIVKDKNKMIVLFALQCLQNKYESVYNYILNRNDSFKPEDLLELRRNISSLKDVVHISDDESNEFKQFISVFIDLLKNMNREDDSKMEEEIKLLDNNFAYLSEIIDELQR